MAKPMGVNPLLHACLAGQPGEEMTNVGAGDASSFERAEERCRPWRRKPPTLLQPAFQMCGRISIYANCSGLVPFAVENAEGGGGRVVVLGVEIESLGDPEHGTIDYREQGAVPDSRRRTATAGRHER